MTSTESAVQAYVRYLYPGVLFPEDTTQPVDERDPQRVAREAPEGVFAFEFFDKVSASAEVNGETIPVTSKAINKTGRYYIDAEKLTAADVEALPGDHKILLANMRGNGWDTILRCRAGNFQPLEDGDSVVSSAT